MVVVIEVKLKSKCEDVTSGSAEIFSNQLQVT